MILFTAYRAAMRVTGLRGKFSERLAPLWNPLMDLVYPPLCFACEKPIGRGAISLCPACNRSLRRVHARDEILAATAFRLRHEGDLSAFIAPWYLEPSGPMRALMHQLRCGGMTSLGNELGRELGGALLRAGRSAVDGIIAVPLHASRRRERGYNQSEFIARGVGSNIGRAVWSHHLCRLRNTRSQSPLTLVEREKNMDDAFVVPRLTRRQIRGKTLLLVDDFVASGATLCACAKALKDEGARTIIGCAVAIVREWPPKATFLDIRRRS